MFQLISEGGAFVWVLLALAFVGMFLILERVLFFQRVRINVGDLLLGLANHVRKENHAEALHEAARAPGPVARVAHATLMRHKASRQDLRDIAQEAGQLEVPRIEKNMRGLYSIALLAPLVGMLGTMSGLINTFRAMNNQGATDSMSQGIYESLVTSAVGLMIAVITYVFYLHFLGRAKRLIHRIERAGIEIVNMICDARDGIGAEILAIEDLSKRDSEEEEKSSKQPASGKSGKNGGGAS